MSNNWCFTSDKKNYMYFLSPIKASVIRHTLVFFLTVVTPPNGY